MANEFETYDAIGNREDLANTISNITPTDTIFMNGVKSGTCNATLHEWQTEALEAVDTSNNFPEGSTHTNEAVTPTVRVGNYTQISKKVRAVTGTQEAVTSAGRASEYARQLMNAKKALMRDQESILLSEQAKSAGSGNGATNRTLGGVEAWLKTNISHGTTGTGTSGATTGQGGAVTDATGDKIRAFTETLLLDVCEDIYDAGGEASVMLVSPFQKKKVAAFSGAAGTIDQDAASTTRTNSVDIYITPFGQTLAVKTSRFCRSRTVNILDMDMFSVMYLKGRQNKFTKLPEDSDNERFSLLSEYTLKVENEASSGKVADLTTS